MVSFHKFTKARGDALPIVKGLYDSAAFCLDVLSDRHKKFYDNQELGRITRVKEIITGIGTNLAM